MLNIGEFARLGQVSPRMLRHYDRLRLLVPERVDPETGYRSYGVQQLVRFAEARAVASGLDPEHIGPIFGQLAPGLIEHLQQAGAQPGLLVGYYDEPEEDGSVGVHVAFEIGAQAVPASDGVEIVELPIVEVASVVHRGSMEHITPVYDALIRWLEDSGFHLAGYSRELYHEMGADGPNVTELQLPIAK